MYNNILFLEANLRCILNPNKRTEEFCTLFTGVLNDKIISRVLSPTASLLKGYRLSLYGSRSESEYSESNVFQLQSRTCMFVEQSVILCVTCLQSKADYFVYFL
jgi:hypothetical protein